MIKRPIDKPIFVIGMPRSGTTVVFEAFAARRDLAWFSQYVQRWPGAPTLTALSRLVDLTPAMRRSVSRSDQRRPWLERLRIGPVEAYAFWERHCGKKFRYDFLLDAEATAQEAAPVRKQIAAILRYQGKPRFAAKITGPGRIRYLSSVFPDARFVHVVRDGRAVVHSLLKAPFWQARSRNLEPAWRHGLDSVDIADWRRHGSSLVALTAVQWRRVVESIRAEAAEVAPDRYAETTYERFVRDPHRVLDGIALVCDLPPSRLEHHFVDRRFDLHNMNYQWIEHFTAEDVATLTDLLSKTLARFGYDLASPTAVHDEELVTRPFATGSADQAIRVAQRRPPPSPSVHGSEADAGTGPPAR